MTNASAKKMIMTENFNGFNKIISQALDEMKSAGGPDFDLNKVNLAELERRTGISRARLRRLKANQFKVLPDKRCGRKAPVTKLTGFTDIIDALLRKDVTNSNAIYDRLVENGYQGGKTIIKNYIQQHKYLIPPRRLSRKPRQTLHDGSGRMLPDGLGFRNGRGSVREFLPHSMLCHDMPLLWKAVHRILPECTPGKPVYRNDPRIHVPGCPWVCSDR